MPSIDTSSMRSWTSTVWAVESVCASGVWSSMNSSKVSNADKVGQ